MMAEGQKLFGFPLEFGPSGQSVSFHELPELLSWAQKEQEYWNSLRQRLTTANPFKTDFFLNPQLSRANRLVSALQQYAGQQVQPEGTQRQHFQQNVAPVVALFNDRPDFTHESALAAELDQLASEDPGTAWLRLAFAYGGRGHNNQPIPAEQVADLVGLFMSFDKIRSSDGHITTVVAALDATITEFKSRWDDRFQKQFDEITHRLDKAQEQADRWRTLGLGRLRNYRTLHSDHATSMKNIEEAFTTKMELQAAEYYWNTKQKNHDTRAGKADAAWWWSMGLGAVVVGAIWAVLIYVSGGGVPDKLSLTQTLMFGLPVIPYLWILRTFATERKLNRRMADDAEERVAMVKTFRALEYTGKISKEERFIVLNALYRPFASDGDESIPIATIEAMKSVASRS